MSLYFLIILLDSFVGSDKRLTKDQFLRLCLMSPFFDFVTYFLISKYLI